MVSKILNVLLLSLLFISCSDKSETTTLKSAEVNILLEQADQFSVASDEFKQLSDSALTIAKKSGDKNGITIAYSNIGYHNFKKRRYYISNNFHLLALKNLDTLLNNNTNAKVWYRHGLTGLRINKLDSTRMSFNKALYYFGLAKDTLYTQDVMNSFGLFYWRQGILDSAVGYFQKSKVIREKLGRKDLVGASLNNLGTVYYQWSIYDRALEFYYQALEVRKEIDDFYGCSIVSTNIGLVQKEIGNFKKAKEFMLQGLQLGIKAGSPTKQGYAISELGGLFSLQNELDSAEYYYRKGLEIFNQENDMSGILLTNIKLGSMFKNKQDYSSAEQYYKAALDIAKIRKSKIRIAQVQLYIGQLFYHSGRINESYSYAIKSVELAEKIEKMNYMRDGYELLSQIYYHRGAHKKAYDYLAKFEEYKSKIYNEDINRKLETQDARYALQEYQNQLREGQLENEKQTYLLWWAISIILLLIVVTLILFYNIRKSNKVNSLLSDQYKLINNQKAELEKTNQTKEKLFSILAHDIKNPFQAMNGYTDLLINDFNSFTDQEKLEYLGEISQTSMKLLDLLDNMTHWSASQTGELKQVFEEVDLCELVDSVVELTQPQARNKEINIVSKLSRCFIVNADKYMLEVVLRNLITNAVKFSYEKSEIVLSTDFKNSTIVVSVADKGTGMDAATLDSVFDLDDRKSVPGTFGEKGTGLGLVLCKEFVEKNGGEIWAESTPGKGSKFSFTLKMD